MEHGLLPAALSVSVPLYIHELSKQSWPERQRIARECAEIVATKGDVILFKSKKGEETKRAFNALAQGIACLAYAPGGVRIFGLHFEAVDQEEPPPPQFLKLTQLNWLKAWEAEAKNAK